MHSGRCNAVLSCAFVVAFLALFSTTTVRAADDGPGAFVSRLGQQTIEKLADVSLTPAARETQFRDLLREGFAVKAIGQFVLGKYRRTASAETVNEFINVFEDYVVALYAKQFKHFNGQKFQVENVINASGSKDSMVATKVFPAADSEPLRVDFQVRNSGDSFKILDVRVEGVSMVLAQRDEFTSYIATNGGQIESLTKALRQRIANGTPKPTN